LGSGCIGSSAGAMPEEARAPPMTGNLEPATTAAISAENGRILASP
jgi:hypothetical protein